jgi:ABC-type multidrug transport system ATPase subunit
MGPPWDLAFGAAVFFAPPQAQLPLTLGAAALRAAAGALGRRRRRRRAAGDGGAAPPPAAREVTLEWSHLSCFLAGPGGAERVLLDGLSGAARPGRVLALIGPSGAGKTTLLAALAGQMPRSSRVRLEGAVVANGAPVAACRPGYVPQEDLFFSQLTVAETLALAAEMRLAAPPAERAAAVAGAIRRLGLAKCADTRVGDVKTRGLSGGERRRLSIAAEVIASPRLLFLDEPTSGLDAFAALQVARALKALADDGHTVVASVHQPRSAIFELLDDLCLLSEGKLLYQGDARAALAHFAALGYACPAHYNPAEFLSDLVAVDYSSPEAEAASRARVGALADAWAAAAPAVAVAAAPGAADAEREADDARPAIGPRRQAVLLFRRAWRQVARDRAAIASRASSQLSSAAVFSAVYYKLGRGQAGIQGRLGLLQVAAVGTAMSSLIKTLNVFPRERAIVARERARAAYPPGPYLAAKLAAELPVGALFPALFGALVYPAAGLAPGAGRFARFLGILVAESFSAQALGLAVGAAAPSTEAALAIGPAVILVSIVFGGLFTSAAGVPAALRWAPRTSLIKHAFEGACINELRGAAFELGPRGRGDATGEDVLARLAFESDSVRGTVGAQARVCAFYWWACLCALRAAAPRPQPLLPPRLRAKAAGAGAAAEAAPAPSA